MSDVSDPFGPDGPTPPLPPPVAPQSSGRPEFLQPKYLIGLGVAAALMLVAGIAAITTGGGDESVATRQVSTTSSAAPTTTRVLTTTPPPLPATTTTSTTTSTTSSTSTTTTSSLPPVPAVANAGDDLAVDADATVTLTALDLSDQHQSIVWRQVAGPDVTDGRDRLIGAEVTFVAPSRPTTLRFTVTVTGRGGDAVNDDVRVDVYEQADRALFVDGVDGSNGGDGSRAQPYRDLSTAISAAEARGDGTDIYIRTVESAYAVDAEIRNGSSMYGGYDADWVKSDQNKALIGGSLLFAGSDPIVVSSIDLRGFNDVDGSVLGVIGAASVRIEGSVVRAGNTATGGSIAVLIEETASAQIINSEIYAGRGGSGARALGLESPEPPLIAGSAGNNASGSSGGTPLAGKPVTRGGDGGLGLVAGDRGGGGALGGLPRENGAPGAGGAGGAPGRGGAGGVGLGPDGLVGAAGMPGASGGDGQPGGGGGGGGGLILHDGGGAGGGGGAGQGGPGGLGGIGGYPSIALYVRDVATFQLQNSVVVGGVGGGGGDGGTPLNGSFGGDGGLGAPGVTSFLDTAGSGSNGGGGGSGGQGGWGGGGSGGPSIGLLTIDVGTVLVSDSEIRGGQGGSGGAGGQPSAGGDPGTEGGAGGAGLGASRSGMATQSSGGDSVGWRDDSDAQREIVGSTMTGGLPGDPGGVGGRTGVAIDTSFSD